MLEAGFYTVIEDSGEQRINLNPIKNGGCRLQLGEESVTFDHQQLAEFGSLLIAMANIDDPDSIPELLEGYGALSDDFLMLRDQLVRITHALADYIPN